MDTLLFSERSVWTMIHGMALGGGALLGLAAAVFALRTMPAAGPPVEDQARALTRLLVAIAVLLWLTVLVGTYVSFPPYRAAPPEGATDLTRFPRSLLLSRPDTAWLHAVGMEIKEHVPWMVAMLGTAAAFIAVRLRSRVLAERPLRTMVQTLVTLCFILAAAAALLGVFINKVAPLE